jgi:hypothetical protein
MSLLSSTTRIRLLLPGPRHVPVGFFFSFSPCSMPHLLVRTTVLKSKVRSLALRVRAFWPVSPSSGNGHLRDLLPSRPSACLRRLSGHDLCQRLYPEGSVPQRIQTNFSAARGYEREIQPALIFYSPSFASHVYRGITHFSGRNSCPTGKSPEDLFSAGREERNPAFDFLCELVQEFGASAGFSVTDSHQDKIHAIFNPLRREHHGHCSKSKKHHCDP